MMSGTSVVTAGGVSELRFDLSGSETRHTLSQV
jgi:hypothetical protein